MEALIQRRPHVMLEWDSAQNKVVAPRSQVAISWSQASVDPTKTAGSHSGARLVDGFGIPQELLELPNLNDILSVETWENCLTHSERELLSMYIPEGIAPESTVEALLSGENFHFGNPLEKWGESVCSGDMHPDAILHRESKVKEEWKAYTKRLRNYHGNLLRNLQNMKEIWEECENPEDVLPQIQGFGRSGQRSHGGHRKNVFQLSRKTVESADLKKRPWTEVGEGVDQARDMPTRRPKAKKQKVSKLPDEGSKRLKMKPPEFETERLKIKPSEGPSRVKTKPTVETADFAMRLKGSKVRQPEEGTKTLKLKTSDFGTKRLKIKSPEEGAKGPEMKPLEEERKKGQLKPLQDETRRPKMKPSDEAAKRPEIKFSGEGIKELKMKPSQDGTKTLKIKQSEDGRKKPEIKPAEEGSKRLHSRSADHKDTAIRPSAKRLKVKPSEEVTKRLEGQHGEEGTKKSQIRLSEAGRKTQQYQSPEEEKKPPSRAKAKRSKVKSLEEEGIQRTTVKLSDEGSKSLKNKPSREGPKLLKMEPAEEVIRTLQVKGPRGGNGVKVKPFDEAAQRAKIMSPEENNILPRPKEKRSKVQPSEQGTKKLNIKRTQKGQEGHELGPSDFEGEWFKKYVLVTIGPLSGQRLSKAIQEVQVTTKILKDVKRRSEAGEEVHLDNLVPVEAPSKKKKASKKAVGPSRIEERIASFWQTVLIKELPAGHARFMQRKEQMQKLAISLAASSESLWEIELDAAGYASPSADYASPSPGVASQASPSGGEPSLSEHEALPSGGEASPSGGEPSRTAVESRSGGETSPSGDEPSASDGDPSASGTEASPSGGEASPNGVEAVQSGDEAWPSGDEAVHSGDEAVHSGDEAVPSGDEAVPSGDEALASDDEASGDDALGSGDEASPELEQKWGINSFRR